MTKTFRQALGLAISQTDQTLRDVAEQAHVPLETLEALMREKDALICLSEAERIAQHFDVTLEQFLENSEISSHIAVARLYSTLPPLLKAQLEAYDLTPDADEDPSP